MAPQKPKLTAVFRREGLIPDLQAPDTQSALKQLVAVLSDRDVIAANQAGIVLKALLKREELGSTAIGKGIAVPHAKHAAVREVTGVLALSEQGVAFNALDGQPVHVIFMVLSPPEAADEHIQVLRKIIDFVKDEDMLRFLRRAAGDVAGMADLLAEADDRLDQK